MQTLHFTTYRDVFGCMRFQTANTAAAEAVAETMKHRYNTEHGVDQYIISRRCVDELEQRGYFIRII